MANKSFEKCVEHILRDIEKRKTVDYLDKNSIRRYNAAADRMFANATYINDTYPERTQEFVELIYHPDPRVAFTCACLVIYRISGPIEAKRAAIAVARDLYERNQLDAGTANSLPMILQRWENQYCNPTE